MIVEALVASALVAIVSLVGVFFFGDAGRLVGVQRYVVPVAVGVFLSLVLYELVPETLEASPEYGGLVVALGFLMFYVLANVLHAKLHHHDDDCDRKGAGLLILVGDTIHNLADGIILGGAFLINPTVGFATALGLALHEIPQEIVEFGVLVRAGYSRTRAALLNLLSASSIFLGTLAVVLLAPEAGDFIWILTGVAAGNLLFLAASELLPRIHGNLPHYGSVWHATTAVIIGFVVMTGVLTWTHEQFHHGDHQDDHHDDEMHAQVQLATTLLS